MEKVIEMGGHDYINVRVDKVTTSFPPPGKTVIWAATAVAIKYTDETLKDESIETKEVTEKNMNENTSTTTTTTTTNKSTRWVVRPSSSSLFSGSSGGGGIKGFFGKLFGKK
jgi:hypothetical protein